MTEITVVFDKTSEDKDFPIQVTGIEEHLFDNAGGNFIDRETEDGIGFTEFVQSVTPETAIEEARDIVYGAPGFDHIPYKKLEHPDITATVVFDEIELNNNLKSTNT